MPFSSDITTFFSSAGDALNNPNNACLWEVRGCIEAVGCGDTMQVGEVIGNCDCTVHAGCIEVGCIESVKNSHRIGAAVATSSCNGDIACTRGIACTKGAMGGSDCM